MITTIEVRALCTALQAVAHACPTKDIRHYLNGIRFEVIGAELIMVATDGHRMACAAIACGATSESPNFTLAQSDIKRLIQHLQALEKGSTAWLDLHPDIEVGILFAHDSLGVRHPFMMLRGDGGAPEKFYPDWRRVSVRPGQGKDNPSQRVDGESFNPEYLVDALKACSTVCKGARKTVHQSRVLLTQGDNGQQRSMIHVAAGGVELECTVMGLRG